MILKVLVSDTSVVTIAREAWGNKKSDICIRKKRKEKSLFPNLRFTKVFSKV